MAQQTLFLEHCYVPYHYDTEHKAYVLDHANRVSIHCAQKLSARTATLMLEHKARHNAYRAVEAGDGFFAYKTENGSVEGWYLVP